MRYYVANDGSKSGIFFDDDQLPANCTEVLTQPENTDYCLCGDGDWIRGKKATLRKLAGFKDSILEAGYIYQGYTYQLREMDKNNLVLAVQAIQNNDPLPTNGKWRTKDNIYIDFTDAELMEFAGAALGYFVDVLQAWSAHKDALNAIVATEDKTVNELCSEYDITVGWPVNE